MDVLQRNRQFCRAARDPMIFRGHRPPVACLFGLLLAIIACLPGVSVSDTVATDEASIKAAFLFNFAKFIEWPDNRLEDGLHLCTVGNDPARHAVAALSGKQVQGAAVIVRHLATVIDGVECDMVFMATHKRRLVDGAASIPSLYGVVTVGNRIEFAREGGIIAFTVNSLRGRASSRNHMGFAINVEAANAAGVNLRSNLLKLATVVKSTG